MNFEQKSNDEVLDDVKSRNTRSVDKLPLKSIHGRRCLTECYPKGIPYVHPVLLNDIMEKYKNTCAIEPIHSTDPSHFPRFNMMINDDCLLEDNNIYKPPHELESILLNFEFNARDFLDTIYELRSFDQVIYWTLENDHLPFNTIKRVHNCAWKVFGNKLEELSNPVLEYYYDISVTYWLKQYVKIFRNRYSFNITSDTPSSDFSDEEDARKEIYRIIREKYYTYEFFVSTIKRYVYEYQDRWDNIDFHYDRIKRYIFNQLVDLLDQEENVSEEHASEDE